MFAVLWFIPSLFALYTSLKENATASLPAGTILKDQTYTLHSYVTLFQQGDILNWYLSSAITSVLNVVLTVLDIFVLLLIVGGAAIGFVRGLVHEVISLLGWVAAIAMLKLFHGQLTTGLTGSFDSTPASAAVIAFALLFIPTYVLVKLLARFYERFADHAVSVARRVVFLVTGENVGGDTTPAMVPPDR